MRKSLLVIGAFVASASLLAATPALATSNTHKSDHKIGICHATGSKTNPYVYINVDKHAADAHARHQDGRDVIGVKSAKDCPKVTPAAKPTPTPTPNVVNTGQTLGASTVQPTTLPGVGAGLSTLIGLPALALAGHGYLRSRRNR